MKDKVVIQSMCWKDNCYENDSIKFFHVTLKLKMLYVKKIKDSETMRLDLFEFIEGFYNVKRSHNIFHTKI
ncbi:MAG: hypothetical protein ACRCSK_00255 [Fusobacteriaceae bacterium]